jgi:hypothetical protein
MKIPQALPKTSSPRATAGTHSAPCELENHSPSEQVSFFSPNAGNLTQGLTHATKAPYH